MLYAPPSWQSCALPRTRPITDSLPVGAGRLIKGMVGAIPAGSAAATSWVHPGEEVLQSLGNNIANDVTVDVSQAAFDSIMVKGKLFVINAQ